MRGFEPVIGLEIHVQLRTATKLFCANRAEFGAPPNTHVCPVCLGLPGALPVTNRQAVELGLRAALGLGCEVHPRSVFARKHYFYPDLPKGYQISQYDQPLATGGFLDLPNEESESERVRIRRIHLEEDAGKSLHDRIPGASAIDLNRAGVPLIEIVTEPDLRSPAQARAFLVRLRQLLEYLEVSDCNLEEGSLRVDANVSLRPPGETQLGTKTEIKNLNSFAFIERALLFEIERQEGLLRSGAAVEHQTLLWDAGRGEARTLRTKEETHDYRYFPDPDLPPLVLEPQWLEEIRRSLPELPGAKLARFRQEYGLPAGHAEVLTATRELADYYEETVRHGADPREAANWILGEVLAAVKAEACALADFRLRPPELAGLLGLIASGTISRTAAKQVFRRMLEMGRPAERIVEEEGLAQVRDLGAIDRWVEEVIKAYPAEVERYRGGEVKLLGFFVGQVMRRSGEKADAAQVNPMVRERLQG